MARPGPLPANNRVGHSPQAEWTDVRDEPYVLGEARDLPDREWNPLTLAWWGVLRTMPHAALWREGDWLSAVDLAFLKQSFYAGMATAGEVSEIRKREDLLGMTTEARNKLRIRYVSVAGKPQEPVSRPSTGTVVPLTVQRRSARDARRRDLLEDSE
jgi:hypothetical protein